MSAVRSTLEKVWLLFYVHSSQSLSTIHCALPPDQDNQMNIPTLSTLKDQCMHTSRPTHINDHKAASACYHNNKIICPHIHFCVSELLLST